MYAALWRVLPGPRGHGCCCASCSLVVVVAVCFQWVFPAISPHLPFTDNTVGAAAAPDRAPWSA